MKKLSKILIPALVLATLLLSACTGIAAPADALGGSKVQSAPVEFTGVIETITADQWVINGQTILIDPAVVRAGSFKVGDTVKVGVEVAKDGTIVMKSVEIPLDVSGNSNDTNSNDTNSNDTNSNDTNGNDTNSNDDNGNDDNSNDSNGNDDNSNDSNDNGNDDNSNDSNDNDDNGNDDNSNDDSSNDDSSNDDNGNDDNSNGG